MPGAAALEATADGSLLDSEGQPLVFVHRKLLERKLQSYASDHALAISLGTILSFMAIKVGGCPPWTGTQRLADFLCAVSPLWPYCLVPVCRCQEVVVQPFHLPKTTIPVTHPVSIGCFERNLFQQLQQHEDVHMI